MKKSKLKAPMWKIIVKIENNEFDEDRVSAGGIVLETKKKNAWIGIIEDVGPAAGCYQYWPDLPKQEFKIGAKVVLYKYAGAECPNLGDGYKRLAINDVDIQAIIEENEE